MFTVHTAQLLSYHETLDPGQSPLKTRLLLELRKVLLIFISIYFDKVTSPSVRTETWNWNTYCSMLNSPLLN